MGLAGWVLFVGLQAFEPPEELVELAALDVHVVAPVRSPPPPTLHIPAAQARSGALQQAALRDLLRMYAAICEPPDAGDPRHCWRTVCIEPDLFRTWAAFALASGSADCLLHYERYLRTCHPDDPDRVVVQLLVAAQERSAQPSGSGLGALAASHRLVSEWTPEQVEANPVLIAAVVESHLVQAAEVQLHWWPELPAHAEVLVHELYDRAASLAANPAVQARIDTGRAFVRAAGE